MAQAKPIKTKKKYLKEMSTINKKSKGSFDSHHLELESKNSFMIPKNYLFGCHGIGYESYLKFHDFHLMAKLNSFLVLRHFCGFSKKISSCYFILFLPNKINKIMVTKRALKREKGLNPQNTKSPPSIYSLKKDNVTD
jgi:hypothetical protein